ncbi:DNA repair protein RecO [Candidatus Dojkabacteria bacterium]|uniref:DNA repair protein RecO n=1 Tax=Candidatus Dojkabacteria bacterium TaxID=2099670 RepID=A0A955L278_9BACT|nr:DNA repair protein RecO [Candidatus Dojkabacteria bacterium]
MRKTKNFEGILFRLYNSGAADKIAIIINKSGSKLVLLAKGAKKSTSKKSSYLEIGNYIKGSYLDGYAVPILNEVNIISEFSVWKKSVTGAVAIQFLCEVMDKFCIEEHDDKQLFLTFEETLKAFSEARLKMLLAIFCLKILDISGHTPETAQIELEETGNLSERLIKTQKFILKSPIELALKVNLTDQEQEKMLQLHVNLIEEILEYPLKSKSILFNIMKNKQ